MVDMTTSEPALAEEIAAAAAAKGVESVDAPVSGKPTLILHTHLTFACCVFPPSP